MGIKGKGKKKAHVECEEDNRCSRSSILPPFPPPPTKGRKFYFRGLAFGVSIFVLQRDQKKSLLPLRTSDRDRRLCLPSPFSRLR